MDLRPTSNTIASATATGHVALQDQSWALWRWSVLRSAGFPADYPLRLANPMCATAADDLGQCERDTQAAIRALVAAIIQAMDADPAQRIFFENIIQKIRRGKLPEATGLPQSVKDALTNLHIAQDHETTTHVTYQPIFAAAMIQANEELYKLVQQEPFRQALTWQNRQALHTALDQFLAKPVTSTNSRYGKHRLMLVKYLQRYALKNDTIGFFGPVGWARWTDDNEMSLQSGTELLASRHVYLEGWGINALSQALTLRLPALLPWAIPRLMPFASLEQQTLRLPFVKPLPLSMGQARVLAACDGTRTAQTLARQIVAEHLPGLPGTTDVYALLTQLYKARRITWSFDVAYEDPYPERKLRQRLEQVAEPELRIAALAVLARLEQDAQAVREARSTAQLDAALSQLEQTFTDVTEQPSTRSAGQMYAGRTLIYEDCRRDIEVTLGRQILQGLEAPLGLLLASARWLEFELTQAFTHHCREIYAELAQKQGTAQLPFTQFFSLVNALLQESPQTIIPPVVREFQRRWAQVLDLPADQWQIQRASPVVADRTGTAFAAPGAAWPLGSYHCPDVMLAAMDVAAINRGDFLYILGELHLGMNTSDAPLFVLQHPHPDDLFQSIASDLPEPRVVPVFSQEFFPATRTHQILAQPKDYRLVTVPEVCEALPARTLRLGDLVIADQDGLLEIRTLDGQRHFSLMQIFGEYFSLAIGDSFALLAPAAHTPRITIDRVVIVREAWRMLASDLPFITIVDHAECFVSVRQWAQQHGMPRFLFYRTPKEKKPCYLDLESPLYVELFVKEARRSTSDKLEGFVISLSEMIPDPHHLWLVDAAGARYASELRIIAVDQAGSFHATIG